MQSDFLGNSDRGCVFFTHPVHINCHLSQLLQLIDILTSYCCLYIATPLILSTAEFFTTKKETRQTASAGISNNTYLNTVPTSTFTTRIKAPGAAKELLTKNNAYFSTVTSSTAIFTTTRKGTPKATTKISKDNTYENGIIDSHSAHNQSSSIYLLIVLPVIAILILLLVVGIIFYWRRWVMFTNSYMWS